MFPPAFLGHQEGEDYPAVGRVKRTAKRHMELFDGELPDMMLPVHLRRSTVAAIDDCPVRDQFIVPRSLKPAAVQSICFFEESLIRQKD